MQKTNSSCDEGGFLKRKGKELINRGFKIVPIRAGSKAPDLPQWQSLKADIGMWEAWQKNPKLQASGVGVLCRYNPAVDIDVLDEEMSKRFSRWVIDFVGDTPIRFGVRPKCLLPYYTEEPFRKKMSQWWEDKEGRKSRVEILGDGQQFVAYHQHPDTNQPYTWEGEVLDEAFPDDQGLMHWMTYDLPSLSEAQAEAIVKQFDQFAKEAGWTLINAKGGVGGAEGATKKKKAALVSVSSDEFDMTEAERNDAFLMQIAKGKIEVTMERAEQMLEVLKDWNVDHDVWVSVGMALHYEFNASAEALALWDRWSADTVGTYKPGECRVRWRSFQADRDNAVTFATVVAEYKKRGGDSSLVDEWIASLAACENRVELVNEYLPKIGGVMLSKEDNNVVIHALKKTFKRVSGAPLQIADARRLLREAIASQHEDTSDGGKVRYPLDVPLPIELFPDKVENPETGAVRLKTTIANLSAMLEGYGISVEYDVILKDGKIKFPSGVLLSEDKGSDLKSESDLQKIRSLLALNEIPMSASDFLVALMAEHEVNPLLDWIRDTPWDGETRMIPFCETVTVADFDVDYRNQIIPLWMTQCVAAFDGAESTPLKNAIAKYENVLVFQSKQGGKKTSWFRALMPKAFQAYIIDGVHLDVGSTDSIHRATSCGICELGEVDSTFRKSDQSRIKAFLSNPFDVYRMPYARTACKFRRRTSFCATVNDISFLVDRTGNRRFYPLAVLRTNPDHGFDMQQVWAEVWDGYINGAQWWASDAIDDLLDSKRERHAEEDSTEDALLRVLWRYEGITCDHQNIGAEFLSATELAQLAGIPYSYRVASDVCRAMSSLGAEKARLNNRRGFWVIRKSDSETDFEALDVSVGTKEGKSGGLH